MAVDHKFDLVALAGVICAMPKEELWLGMAGQDSGSCDSVGSTASNHSGCRNNNYDYLSVEEKECLMFLEETIDSLDAEADSGVSTDETDYAEPSKTWSKREVIPKDPDNRIRSESLAQWHEVQPKGDPSVSALSRSAPALVSSSGCCNLPRDASVVSAHASKASVCKATDLRVEGPTPTAQETGKSSWTSPKKEGIKDTSGDRPNWSSRGKPLESIIIQPPEPFQDPVTMDNQQTACKGSGNSSKDGSSESEAKMEYGEAESSRPRAASQHPAPEEAEVPQKEVGAAGLGIAKHCEMGLQRDTTPPGSQEHSATDEAALDSDLKRGPPTAPKPRKLPPNIILKTSKNNPVPLIIDPSHRIKAPSQPPASHKPSTAAASDTAGHLDPKEQERARREALEKLGLPQDKGRAPDAHVKPATSPKPKEAPFFIPRAASRDDIANDKGVRFIANKSQPHDPSFSGPEEVAPGLRQMHFKSNTLERSGVGLSSYISSSKDQNVKNSSSLGKMSFIDKITPSFLKSSRPRPASLGTGKDFGHIQEGQVGKVELSRSDKRRSDSLQKYSRLAQPPCISVKIAPKGATEEHRREALKKLGLLKE
ncbi:PREDICTED: specifically androgen-regulated gene protein isoform X2 [Crocodylus porosus]|uniref:specifically androgen-regulated gene protein isoform X2 n=1 Tax=Crocodylus porosus TaxID=8502 RepID=UPI00093E6F2E|nr:PREDICTED: specifically androgen-regulated gene protein isoform X2 [Crocodylus porosus]